MSLRSLALLLASHLAAQEPTPSFEVPSPRETGLVFENDAKFLSGRESDRYYTNGAKVWHLWETAPKEAPAAVQKLFRPWVEAHTARFSHGWVLGQNLYTPEKIRREAPQPWDRPWAAWLYGGWMYRAANGLNTHVLEVDLGVIGPLAQGTWFSKGQAELVLRRIRRTAEFVGQRGDQPVGGIALLIHLPRKGP